MYFYCFALTAAAPVIVDADLALFLFISSAILLLFWIIVFFTISGSDWVFSFLAWCPGFGQGKYTVTAIGPEKHSAIYRKKPVKNFIHWKICKFKLIFVERPEFCRWFCIVWYMSRVDWSIIDMSFFGAKFRIFFSFFRKKILVVIRLSRFFFCR